MAVKIKKWGLFVAVMSIGIASVVGLLLTHSRYIDMIKNYKMDVMDKQKPANHLMGSFSPYLRQHQHNPVDWYSWGEEALEKARREDKPILLSIGYSTCYWCHVLERETFTQDDAANIMNENFINIKVDREVRPDLDEVYMTATQLLTGSGGWPNNLLLTPQLKPFYAVTYLPKASWMNMTRQVGEAWKGQRKNIETQANQLDLALKRAMAGTPALHLNLDANKLSESVYNNKLMSYDNRYGGFGTGTKFPQETGLLLLLSYAKTKAGTQALSMVENTVDHMLAGGIHDHIGGGFHRYSTEQTWKIPHFEKMLYNQALMATVLLQLYEDTGKIRYKHALVHLLDYVHRDLTCADGVFYSSQDAETRAVEGAYYVWNQQELATGLTQTEYDFLNSLYHIDALPQFPGHKHPEGGVLSLAKDAPDDLTQAKIDDVFVKLLSVRERREAPLRDDKILTAWNGMMIYALAEAARTLNDKSYLSHAEKAAQFILKNMRQKNGKLQRIYINGAAHQNAFFEDYAWLARGLMSLYRVTGKEDYKSETIKLIAIVDRYFLDKSASGYFMTDDSEDVLVRIKMGDDSGALPSGNPVMAQVFADLYAATGEPEWQARMSAMTDAFAQGMTEQPYIYGHMIHAMSRMKHSETGWVKPLNLSDVSSSVGKPALLESKDKVNVQAYALSAGSATHKTIKVIIYVAQGWHLNGNPASFDRLIPTTVDIQTAQKSILQVNYPDAHQMPSPLGPINIYEGAVEITANVESAEPIDFSSMRALIQVQACQDDICYPASQIVVSIAKEI